MAGRNARRMIGGRCFVSVIGLCLTMAGATALAQDVVPRGEPFAVAANAGFDAPGGRPGIASDGNGFLTVWRDARNSGTHADDPYAARVTRDGTVLDPNGIRLSTSTADAEWPSVAFDGTHYLVVWTAPVGATQYEVYGTIVATDGSVVAADIPITTTGASYNRVISLAYDGTNFLVVWRTWVGSHIRATRVRRNGATLTSLDGTGGFSIATIGGDFYPWVTFGSGQYLVAWHAWGPSGNLDIFAARVSTAGVVLDPEGFIVSSTPELKDHVSVAASGSNYLITFRNQGNEDIYRNARGLAVRIAPNGTVIDTTPIVVAEDVSWGGMMPVVFDGTNYFVLYQVTVSHNLRYMDLMGRRISPAGVLLDPAPVPVAGSFQTQGWLPMFAYGGDRFLAAWTDMGRAHICQPACVGGQILEKLPVSSNATQVMDDLEPVSDSGWQSVASPVGVAIHSVDALDDSTAFAGTDNTYQLRYNGTNWTQWSGSFPGTDLALWGNAPDDVFAVGWTFAPKRFNGMQWIWTNVDAQRGLAQLAQGIWSSGRNDAFMVGTQGRSLRLVGSNWMADPTGVGMLDLWDVWGSAPNDVYAVGERGTLIHWDGTTWSRVPDVPTRQNLNAIWGTSATSIFAVGDFGTILHFDGVAWTQQPSGTTKHLTGVAGLSPTAVFASGFTGTILRYNGATWQSEDSGTTTNLLDVAVGGNTVWVVGDYGAIRRNVIDASHCTRLLDRTAVAATPAGGASSVNFSTNCAWRSWSNAPWIVLDSSSNGVGNVSVSFTVQPNASATSRIGTLIVGTQTVTVTQAGAGGPCTFTLNPTSANHGAGAISASVSVIATNADCGWSAVSTAPWITVTSGSSGTGIGTVGYSLVSNDGPASRSGTIAIAGLTFNVTQAGAVGGLIRAPHVLDLRTAINQARVARGLAEYAFTDALTPQSTVVRAIHITELRQALDEVYAAARLPRPNYTDQVITPGVTMVKGVHIAEIRQSLNALP
jgi:hypothetical protein